MSDADELLFQADNVRLESDGSEGSLRVGARTLRFGAEHVFAYPSILLHAIAVSDAGTKYLYCQLDAADAAAADDAVDRATSSVVERLQNGHHSADDAGDADDDDDDGPESVANVTELRFTGLSDEQLAACYEAMSRAAALNPDAAVDADSFFGGMLGAGVGDADMLAAWDAKLDVDDDELADDADADGAPRFDDADEPGGAVRRTTDHEETGTAKKTRTDD